MTQPPYRYVRFRGSPLNLRETEASLRLEGFDVQEHDTPIPGLEISMKEISEPDWNRDHLIVKADTLQAFLTETVATLHQTQSEPFTEKDIKLRKIVLDLYKETSSNISPSFDKEPEFGIK